MTNLGERRKFIESPLEHGVGEIQDYVFDTAPWGGEPSHPSGTVYQMPEYMDVTASKMSGSFVVSGSNVFTPFIQNLENGKVYLFHVSWQPGPFGRLSAYIEFIGKDII